jgi:hypothetical protein
MQWTEEELKRRIEAGEVGAISLDTSIFHRNGLRLETGLLRRLEQFKGSGRRFVLTDIVQRELLKHLHKTASDDEARLRSAARDMAQSWGSGVDNPNRVVELLKAGRTLEDVARRRVEGFVERTGAEIILSFVFANVRELVDRYFDVQPPFEAKESKKNEFPDALALLTLDEWARQRNTKIVVVSADEGWRRFVRGSERLVLVEDLVEALNAFQEEAAAHTLGDLIRQQLLGEEPELIRAIQSALSDSGDKMEFDLEASSQFYVEGDVDCVSFKSIDLEQLKQVAAYRLIDHTAESLVASLVVDVEYSIEASFSFDYWDGIDKEYMSMGGSSIEVDETIPVEVILTFFKDDDEPYELGDIEVVASGGRVEVGDIEPGWMSEPDDD